MGKKVTACGNLRIWLLILAAAGTVAGQSAPEWRHVGNSAVDLGLAGLASGPVDRVWFTPDGSKLLIRTASGRTFDTDDFERWSSSDAQPVAAEQGPVRSLPEEGASARTPNGQSPRACALAQIGYRSATGAGHSGTLLAF